MINNFYPSASKTTVNDMTSKFENINQIHPVSPAALENYLSSYESSAQVAVDNLENLEKNVTANKFSGEIDKTIIYHFDRDQHKWVASGKPQTKRNWEAFVHDKETKEKLLKDVKLFLQSRDLYQQNGLPFRRGYLFHGKDGSGKMSMALSLAAKLNYRVCSMDLTEKDLTVSCLKQRLRLIPNQCLVLIENLDALSSSQKGKKNKMDSSGEEDFEGSKDRISTTAFCTAIESFEAETSPILIMTSKDRDNIDTKILHPGR